MPDWNSMCNCIFHITDPLYRCIFACSLSGEFAVRQTMQCNAMRVATFAPTPSIAARFVALDSKKSRVRYDHFGIGNLGTLHCRLSG